MKSPLPIHLVGFIRRKEVLKDSAKQSKHCLTLGLFALIVKATLIASGQTNIMPPLPNVVSAKGLLAPNPTVRKVRMPMSLDLEWSNQTSAITAIYVTTNALTNFYALQTFTGNSGVLTNLIRGVTNYFWCQAIGQTNPSSSIGFGFSYSGAQMVPWFYALTNGVRAFVTACTNGMEFFRTNAGGLYASSNLVNWSKVLPWPPNSSTHSIGFSNQWEAIP